MKWENDIYRFIKWDIFYIIEQGLTEADAEIVNMKKVLDGIDLLFSTMFEEGKPE